MFKNSKITSDGVMFQKVVEEVLSPPSTTKKSQQRLKIEEEVFDVHDSIADTTKWLSLLSSMIGRIYSIIPEDQKTSLSQQDRQFIEYAIQKFSQTTTRADVQFQQEGVALIDKIFDRQEKMANLIK